MDKLTANRCHPLVFKLVFYGSSGNKHENVWASNFWIFQSPTNRLKWSSWSDLLWKNINYAQGKKKCVRVFPNSTGRLTLTQIRFFVPLSSPT